MLSLLRSRPRAIFAKSLCGPASRGVAHLPPLDAEPRVMTQVHKDILKANATHALGFVGKHVATGNPRSPALHAAFLTCMDARLDPHDFIGIRRGDAHVIRNAGGRASEDAIRSLVVSHKLLGTTEWFIIHHTDCGMEAVDSEQMGKLLSESLATAKFDPESKKFVNPAGSKTGGSYAGKFVNWLAITEGQIQSIKEDVHRVVTHPLVNTDEIICHGYLYHVKTGKMEYVCSGGKGTNNAVAHADHKPLQTEGPEVDSAVRAARSSFYVPPTPREHQQQGAQDQAKVAVLRAADEKAAAAAAAKASATSDGSGSCGTRRCGCGDSSSSSDEEKAKAQVKAQQRLS